MGTVIFPDSPLKFFVKADEKVRLARRLKQLYGDIDQMPSETRKVLIKKMEIEVSERDTRDSKREVAPTVPAADAIIIDNSSRPLTIVFQEMYDAARKLAGT